MRESKSIKTASDSQRRLRVGGFLSVSGRGALTPRKRGNSVLLVRVLLSVPQGTKNVEQTSRLGAQKQAAFHWDRVHPVLWINRQKRKCSCHFQVLKWYSHKVCLFESSALYIPELVKSLPFYIPEAWKQCPFGGVKPPRIGHYREWLYSIV